MNRLNVLKGNDYSWIIENVGFKARIRSRARTGGGISVRMSGETGGGGSGGQRAGAQADHRHRHRRRRCVRDHSCRPKRKHRASGCDGLVGNVDLEQIAKNALMALELAGSDARV